MFFTYNFKTRAGKLFLSLCIVSALTNCTAIKVVDIAASTAIGVTVGAVKTTGKIIDVATDDDDENN